MSITNIPLRIDGRRAQASEMPVTSANWRAYRAAYDEVRVGAPPDYDRQWMRFLRIPTEERAALIASRYETMREACLTMKLAGTLPTWARNRRLPPTIAAVYGAVKQERRLGREANLVLTLTPPPVAEAELAAIY